jgi:hypothetical protein
MNDLPYTITLVAGDWSHDGHSISHNEWIKSNLTSKEIQKAYKDGVEKIGVDLSEDICAEYGEESLEFQYFKKFIDAGFLKFGFELNKNDLKSIEKEEDIEYLDSDFFVALYLFTVFVGNGEFKYEMVENEENNIDIGAYGLFGN